MSTDRTENPFFARYLEGQDYPSVRTDIKAGPKGGGGGGGGGADWPPAETQKYPSDNDDDPIEVS